jgi:hypothetical protein
MSLRIHIPEFTSLAQLAQQDTGVNYHISKFDESGKIYIAQCPVLGTPRRILIVLNVLVLEIKWNPI